MPYLAAAFLTLLAAHSPPPPAAAAGAAGDLRRTGMRNPYRWSFDRLTGDMYVGDVGGTNEEITYLPAAQSSRREPGLELLLGHGGAVRAARPPTTSRPTYTYPSGADVVIGGYVVRDPALPAFAGPVPVRPLQHRDHHEARGRTAAPRDGHRPRTSPNVSGFGEDGVGHLYATSLTGPVYRLGQSGAARSPRPASAASTSRSPWPRPRATPNQLFIVEKTGTRPSLRTPAGTSEFLDTDLTGQTAGGEQGLLAFAVVARLRDQPARVRLLRRQRRRPAARRVTATAPRDARSLDDPA